MTDALSVSLSSSFVKTDVGQREVQTRSLRLGPLARRVLILVDGRRTGQELSSFSGGGDIASLLGELLRLECIAAVDSAAANDTSVAVAVAVASVLPDARAAAPTEDDLAGLPPADTRGPKDVEMARNFMTNTVNTIFGHHNRISLIESIHLCQSAEDLRRVFPAWKHALEGQASAKNEAARAPSETVCCAVTLWPAQRTQGLTWALAPEWCA